MTPEQSTEYERLKQAALSVWHAGTIYIGPSMSQLMRFLAEYKRPSPEYEQPASVPDWLEVTRFLTDVTTAAGMLEHGRRDKGLARRIGDFAHKYRMLATAPATAETVKESLQVQPAEIEHDFKDVRCGCCGYMTYHREHMGCIRAAAPAAPEQDAVAEFKSVTPDCNTCANRGASYGLSQESCCSYCIYGSPWRKNLYQPDANKLSTDIAAEKGTTE